MTENAIETASLLIVSRDAAVLRPLYSIGESNVWKLESAVNAWEAMERVQSGAIPDLLLLDLPHGDADGLHILRWLRRLRPAMPIILIGHPDDVDRKQEAIRLGARDYLMRPLDEGQLEAVVRSHLSAMCTADGWDITSEDVEPVSNGAFFIGISPVMRELRAQVALLAEANVPVLILGEGGSGKETTARLIHKLSVRSGFGFAKVNCAALPGDLLERELFGYERDNATGSSLTKPGKLEHCAKGTILLDEITEMPMGVQANVLQVLQSGRFIRPGTSAPVEVDIRILVASTTDVEHAISENKLREDLYYRLSAYTIHVPPLRKRMEDLPSLSRHFMHQLARRYGLSPRDFSPAILDAYQTYPWPGNLRELKSVVKRYLVVGDKELAMGKDRSHLDEATWNAASPSLRSSGEALLSQRRDGAPGSGSLRSLVQSVKLETERNAIAAALKKTGWNRKAAAGLLKVSYRTLLYKIAQYEMRASDSSLLQEDSGLKGRVGFYGDGRRY